MYLKRYLFHSFFISTLFASYISTTLTKPSENHVVQLTDIAEPNFVKVILPEAGETIPVAKEVTLPKADAKSDAETITPDASKSDAEAIVSQIGTQSSADSANKTTAQLFRLMVPQEIAGILKNVDPAVPLNLCDFIKLIQTAILATQAGKSKIDTKIEQTTISSKLCVCDQYPDKDLSKSRLWCNTCGRSSRECAAATIHWELTIKGSQNGLPMGGFSTTGQITMFGPNSDTDSVL